MAVEETEAVVSCLPSVQCLYQCKYGHVLRYVVSKPMYYVALSWSVTADAPMQIPEPHNLQ